MESTLIVEKIRQRAKASRKFAQYMVFVNIGIVIAILGMFFINPGQHSLNSNLDSRVEFSFIGLKYERDQSLKMQKETPASKEATEEITKLREQNKQLELAANERSYLMDVVGDTVLRFGSVLLAIYLIQILVTFTRYHFRIANHLDATADVLELSDGKTELLEKLYPILSPKDIEFGSAPSLVQDKVAEIVQTIIAKLPGK